MVEASSSQSGDTGSIPAGCWLLCHFVWYCARQWTDTRAYILLCSQFSFFLEFRHWQSGADRVLTLNMNIRLQLFGAVGVGPWVSHVGTWCMGSNYSSCIASEHSISNGAAVDFSWIVEKTEKLLPMPSDFQPLSPWLGLWMVIQGCTMDIQASSIIVFIMNQAHFDLVRTCGSR